MDAIEIIEVDGDNVRQEGLFCLKNVKNPGFGKKVSWLEDQWKLGLQMIQLKVNGELAGFIEYLPGEVAWRPVKAAGYLFIHCMWVYPKKFYNRGFASRLVRHVVEEARTSGKAGVAVQVSKGSWMAGPDVFAKNGFVSVDSKARFELMVKKIREYEDPSFINWDHNLSRYEGLNLVIAHQCPLFIKPIGEMTETARTFGHELKVTELTSPQEAQRAPSGYGVYSLVYNGKLLADHYISNTRFRNILTKEL